MNRREAITLSCTTLSGLATARRRRQRAAIVVTAVALLAWVSLPALETARMQLSPEFSVSAERLTASGIGGRNKGQYKLGDYRGDFRRTETRLGVFDPLYVRNKGGTAFTVDHTGDSEALQVDCRFRKGAVSIGVVTFDPKKFAYDCDFRRNGMLVGSRLAIGQPKAATASDKILARDLRRGEAVVDNTHFVIDSVHRYEGTKLGSQAPVGYLMLAGDTLAAAVELTDVNPTLYLGAGLSPAARHAATTVGLALALMRDPAHSALED